MFSIWDFRSAGAFPAFLLTELASVPAWQFAAGYAQLHGFALPHGAETARRCVKHSLLERPGPKGLSPLQAQGLFGSRMGRFSTFCLSKVEKVSRPILLLLLRALPTPILSLSLSPSLSHDPISPEAPALPCFGLCRTSFVCTLPRLVLLDVPLLLRVAASHRACFCQFLNA